MIIIKSQKKVVKLITDELKDYLTKRIGMNIHMLLPFEGSAIDLLKFNNAHLKGELKEVIGNTGWIVYSDMRRVNLDKLLMFWFSDL